jgi:hypothetical protein
VVVRDAMGAWERGSGSVSGTCKASATAPVVHP